MNLLLMHFALGVMAQPLIWLIWAVSLTTRNPLRWPTVGSALFELRLTVWGSRRGRPSAPSRLWSVVFLTKDILLWPLSLVRASLLLWRGR